MIKSISSSECYSGMCGIRHSWTQMNISDLEPTCQNHKEARKRGSRAFSYLQAPISTVPFSWLVAHSVSWVSAQVLKATQGDTWLGEAPSCPEEEQHGKKTAECNLQYF